MTDFSTWPGVNTTWPDYTPAVWSSEGVILAVRDYLADASLKGVRSVHAAKPISWDAPANFFGEGEPWGASLYVLAMSESQGSIFTGNGRPERTVKHHITVAGLFRCAANENTLATTLQRRIEDGVKDAIRNDPTLGGRVFEAGIEKLTATREPEQGIEASHDIWFQIDFEVKVFASPSV